MRKLLGVLLVVGLLAGGVAAYALLSSSSATAQDETGAEVQEESAAGDDDPAGDDTAANETEAGEGADGTARARPQHRDVLGEALDELVADGVITQEQADDVRAAVTAKREELRGERGARGGGPPGFRGLGPAFGHLLDDGVIDADELAELPDGHPLADPEGPAGPYLDDGEITEDELDELVTEMRSQGLFPFERFRGGADQDDAESGSDN